MNKVGGVTGQWRVTEAGLRARQCGCGMAPVSVMASHK